MSGNGVGSHQVLAFDGSGNLMEAIKNLLVLGAGSAGLLMALAVKRRMPQVTVRVVRSPDIGVIGVGESTTPNVRAFLF
jgi:tryptophan halogenase